jgi:hypothetical protein
VSSAAPAFAILALVSSGEPVPFPGSAAKIAQITGDHDATRGLPTRSRTATRAGVVGTDLGSSFEHEGKLYFLFGDTVGGAKHADVLAWTDARVPEEIALDFHRDESGRFLPLGVPGISAGAFEVPSYGISVGGRMLVVFTTGHSKDVVMGRSIVGASKDDGRTFELLGDLSSKHFVNVALAPAPRGMRGLPADDALLVWGSGRYRASNVRFACAPAAKFGKPGTLRYFNGLEGGSPRWSEREEDAANLFLHPVVGELSVAWIAPLERWVMLYNSSAPRGIVMRTAREPWGPWSEPSVVFDPWLDRAYGTFMHVEWKTNRMDSFHDPRQEERWGGEYGPYLIGRFTRGDARRSTIFFTMSTWNPYQVVLMSADVGQPEDSKAREAEVVVTLPGDSRWTTSGSPLRRFERAGIPHVLTFGEGGDKDMVVSSWDFRCGAGAVLEFSVHGGGAQVLLVRERKAPPATIDEIPRFLAELKAGDFGPVVEAVAGPTNNDVDVPVRWNLARHEGEMLRLYVVDALQSKWGFVAVSEIRCTTR